MSVAVAEGLRQPPSYRNGRGCATMPDNKMWLTDATEQIGLLMALAVAAWPTHPPVVKLFEIYTMDATMSYYDMVGIKRGVSLYVS